MSLVDIARKCPFESAGFPANKRWPYGGFEDHLRGLPAASSSSKKASARLTARGWTGNGKVRQGLGRNRSPEGGNRGERRGPTFGIF
jgi:hypothetical protein